MLRLLVACASLAVIAFVGYFFWGEWQRLEAEQVRNERNDAALAAECRSTLADLKVVASGGDLGRRFVQHEARVRLRSCVSQGRLSSSDVSGLGI